MLSFFFKLGSCTCRVGVEGSQCQRSEQGRFFPSLDFMKFEVEDMNGTFSAFTRSEGSRISFTGSGFAILYPGQFAHTSVADMTLASHEYHAVIRYSVRESCFFGSPSKLVLIVNSFSSNDSSEFNIFLDQLPQGSGQGWQSRRTLQLFSDEVYNLTLTYNASDSSGNCSVLVDSLVFIADVNITRVYTGSSEETQNQLQSCVRAKTSLAQAQSEPAQCQGLVFSVSTEIYNGTLREQFYCNVDSDKRSCKRIKIYNSFFFSNITFYSSVGCDGISVHFNMFSWWF